MRDIAFSLFVIGLLPTCYRRPFIGLLMFSWLGYMRAQDLTWGFARNQRWSYLVGLLMTLGWMRKPKARVFQNDPRTYCMLAMCVTILLGMVFADLELTPRIWDKYAQFVKVIFIALLTTSVVNTREHLRILVWVIALSFGFFGVKTGVAGVLSGGSLRVLQGPGGMLEDNNDFSLALCMALPLLVHIGTSERRPIFRTAMKFIVPLTALTVILTYSRGGFLSLAALIGVLVWRSKHRTQAIALVMLTALVAYLVVPQEWRDRISTITDYEQDGSATGRLRAWATAIRMARDNPVLGVGYELFQKNYTKYALPGEAVRVAHNSYLQVWAECGTITLGLYLSLFAMTFLDLWRIRRQARRRYYSSWITSYANMFEASFCAFVVGSTFLNRAHFDLFYHYVAIVMCFTRIARREMYMESTYPVRVSTSREPLAPVRRSAFARPPRTSAFRPAADSFSEGA